jgi:antitoxin (DNA-binding transcriptional repressor) of toxin-antitoxin stability system
METATVELSQAATQLTQLIAQLKTGIEILITSDGLPVARLLPATAAPANRTPGSAKGLFTVPDDFDAPLEDFREHM